MHRALLCHCSVRATLGLFECQVNLTVCASFSSEPTYQSTLEQFSLLPRSSSNVQSLRASPPELHCTPYILTFATAYRCYMHLWCRFLLDCPAQLTSCTLYWPMYCNVHSHLLQISVIQLHSQHHCRNGRWRSCWKFPSDVPNLRASHHWLKLSEFADLIRHLLKVNWSPMGG